MANSAVWEILWVIAAILAGAVMFGAWTGPHRSVSNLSRWATRARIPYVPAWLGAPGADRWAFRGGLIALVLLLAAAWLIPWAEPPASVPSGADSSKDSVAPASPGANRPIPPQRPVRHVDAELKNAILV